MPVYRISASASGSAVVEHVQLLEYPHVDPKAAK